MHALRTSLIAVITASLRWTVSASGQAAPPPVRVRVVTVKSSQTVVTGTLIGFVGDSAVILPDSATVSRDSKQFAIGEAYRLEQSAGMRHRTLRGLGIGFLAGSGVGAILGAASYSKPQCDQSQFLCLDFGRGFSAIAGAVFGSVAGIVIGGISGRIATHEVWRKANNDRDLRVSIIPTGGSSVRMGATMVF